jgi:uncharacterized protein
MKIFLKILLLILAVAVLLWLFFYFAPAQSRVCFASNCFAVKLAQTQAQREQGLMFWQELDKDKGMLFVFDTESIYPFWMKNTLIPLDIIWINKGNKIVFIKENAEPCEQNDCPQINPGVSALYVLELNARTAKKAGVSVGDSVDMQIRH